MQISQAGLRNTCLSLPAAIATIVPESTWREAIMNANSQPAHAAPSATPLAPVRVAIAGFGAIGRALAESLGTGRVPGVTLSAVAARDLERVSATLDGLSIRAAAVPLEELAAHADLVIECAPAALLREIVEPFVRSGRRAVVLSVGALLEHRDLIDLAAASGGKILVPSGALLGLDAVAAAAEGAIHSVKMVTRKPVAGLLGAPRLRDDGIDISDLKRPLRIFSGTAREAVAGFPANLNVAVALSLAGIGADRAEVEIWADPGVTRNTHRIVVESDAARLDMTIENIPSSNPKTGRITAQSVLALLRRLGGGLSIGG